MLLHRGGLESGMGEIPIYQRGSEPLKSQMHGAFATPFRPRRQDTTMRFVYLLYAMSQFKISTIISPDLKY